MDTLYNTDKRMGSLFKVKCKEFLFHSCRFFLTKIWKTFAWQKEAS